MRQWLNLLYTTGLRLALLCLFFLRFLRVVVFFGGRTAYGASTSTPCPAPVIIFLRVPPLTRICMVILRRCCQHSGVKGAKPIFVVGTCRDAFNDEQLKAAHVLIQKEVLKTSPCLPLIRKSTFDKQLTHFIDNTQGRVTMKDGERSWEEHATITQLRAAIDDESVSCVGGRAVHASPSCPWCLSCLLSLATINRSSGAQEHCCNCTRSPM